MSGRECDNLLYQRLLVAGPRNSRIGIYSTGATGKSDAEVHSAPSLFSGIQLNQFGPTAPAALVILLSVGRFLLAKHRARPRDDLRRRPTTGAELPRATAPQAFGDRHIRHDGQVPSLLPGGVHVDNDTVGIHIAEPVAYRQNVLLVFTYTSRRGKSAVDTD